MRRSTILQLIAALAVAVLPAGAVYAQFCTLAFPPARDMPSQPPSCCGDGGPSGGSGAGGAGGGGTGTKGLTATSTGGASAPGGKPADNAGGGCCSASPVYPSTGAYSIAYTDLSIPTIGFPLVASRNYNSAHLIDGPTGIGWSSSFHARLFDATYLYAAPSTYQREAEVIMPDGTHFRYVDNGTGTYTPPAGRYDTLVRNPDGTFDLTLQLSRSKMHFSADGLLLSLTDDYGNSLNYTYDATSARLQRVSDAAGSGRYLDVTWGPNGRISTIQDNSGRNVQYAYNTNGTLAAVTNPAGQTTTLTYVPGRFAQLLSQIKDHWGRVITDLTWDASGRLATYTEDGETYTYVYNYNNISGQTAKTDSAGNRWLFMTGARGLIGERRPPAVTGAASSFMTFTADGKPELATDEVGVKTSYTYTLGRVASVTKDYQGTSAVRFDYTYDTTFPEKVISMIPKIPGTNAYDPNWQGWQYDYYPQIASAPGALYHAYRLRNDGVTADPTVTYTYNSHGQVTNATNATGAVTSSAYDASGNLDTITAPTNNDAGTRPVTTYGYDALGHITTLTDPLAKVTAYAYDALDRVTAVTLPKPSASSPLNFTTNYSYDNFDAPSGLTMTNVTDPNGIVTKQGYDQFGRLRKSVDGQTNATGYLYTRNLLTVITDANNNTTSYQYDALKRLSATVFPNAAQETYAYYADGLLKTRTDRKSQTVTYTYDALKRLTNKAYPNATSVQYAYTGQKLSQVTDGSVTPSETHTFSHDDRFRMNSNAQSTRGTMTYTFDAADRTATTTLAGGATTTYAYYPDGGLNTIVWSPVTGTFKYAYNARGQYASITYPNSQARSFTYDDQGRLLQLANTHPTTGTIATFAYSYDLDHPTNTTIRLGQRTSMTADVPSQSLTGALTKYTYDPNYQLTGVTYPAAAPFNGDVASWTYDAIGNRTSATTNATSTSYTYQTIGTNPLNWQRLLTAGTTSSTYDGNGNTATMTGYTFGTDYENRQTSVTGSVTASYKYDYQGRRTSKTAGTTTTYVYDGLNLIRESATSTSDYLFGPGIDEPLAISSVGAVSYYAVDGLGSVASVNDAAGVIQDKYAYDAWGTPWTATETLPQPFRYTSREVGEVPSQSFYRARYYQADLGRFLSEDPEPYLGAFQRYSYTNNNPTFFVDPYGMYAGPIPRTAPPPAGNPAPWPIAPPSPSCPVPGAKGFPWGAVAGYATVVVGFFFGPAVPNAGGAGDMLPDPAGTQCQQCAGAHDKHEDECYASYLDDIETCKARYPGDASKRVLCFASAADRLAACNRHQPLPQLR